MQKVIILLDKYKKVLRIILPILIIWGMYKVFPYFLMDRPAIYTVEPCEIMEKTSFNEGNQLFFTGKNLKNIIGIYINGIYESNCMVTGSSEEGFTLQIPAHYYQEAAELDIQAEVRINSDLACFSNKATITILPDEMVSPPFINSTEPQILGYDGNLVQDITIQGMNFTEDSVVTVNGIAYATTYDENAKSLIIQVPYECWCMEEELDLQVIQYYGKYPTQIKSQKFFLETDITDLSTVLTQCRWTQSHFIAQSLGEMNGLKNTNSREAFTYNYEHGQRLFGVDMTFSSDGILYGNYEDKTGRNIALPNSFAEIKVTSELTLLSFEDICGLMHDYEDAYVYVSLQDTINLQAFRTSCQYMLTYAKQEYPDILPRLIIPVNDEASYRLLLELYPSANVVYVPDNLAISEYEIANFIQSTHVQACILPWEVLTPSLRETLKQYNCFVYVSGLEETNKIAYALANGADGISSHLMPIEDWQEIEIAFQSGNIDIPSISPEQSENSELLIDYLHALDSKRYLVMFSVKDEASSQLSGDIQRAMGLLGLTHSPVDAFQYSYIAVIDKGTVLYEECDNRFLQYDLHNESMDIHIDSGGYYVGNISSIQINEMEYSVNQRGLNIVVYDYLLEQVIDSVCFDLYDKVSLVK